MKKIAVLIAAGSGMGADAAKELVDTVDKIAEIFWTTKNVTYSDPNAEVRFGA